MGKKKKKSGEITQKEQDRANRVIQGIFVGLIVLALVTMVGYAMSYA